MRIIKMALAFCLITALLFSSLAGMDDHGANVVVTKEDGTLTKGELLAVKRNALVVSAGETSPGESVSIAIEEIGKVKVIKYSNVGKGILWGALIGGGLGVVGGLIVPYNQNQAYPYSIIGGLLFGVLGAGIGAAIAGGGNETFRFEKLSKEERDSALLQLSNYAALKGVR